MKEELQGSTIGFIIFVLIVIGALWIGSTSPSAPADPTCSTVGNC